ncbi:unnamed protein product [Lupinus luteus]|uniref:Polygalacturonase n=1 Tax=Lupinus luteus TaxID=3873 RepID=A0AAV1W1A2_LUPLU
MAAIVSIISYILLCITLLGSSHATPTSTYNVIAFGAKPDGKFDSTGSFIKAWQSACTSPNPATIYVPKGRYLLNAINFRGPCKNQITVLIAGTLVAPQDYWALGNSGFWILFNHLDNLVVSGGYLDAKGAGFWDCRRYGKSCPVGARSMTFNSVNNLVVSGITSINSQHSHLVINTCNNVLIKNVRAIAPAKSPNTDGIHVERSNGVIITGCTLQTGDDCISIADATFNLFISHIKCGPGHGSSGIKISRVTYNNIKGTSATPEAITFDCSPSYPCEGIKLQDINLTYNNETATSTCKNIGGTSNGTLVPETCL